MDVYDEIVRLRREGRRSALATIIDPYVHKNRRQRLPPATQFGIITLHSD